MVYSGEQPFTEDFRVALNIFGNWIKAERQTYDDVGAALSKIMKAKKPMAGTSIYRLATGRRRPDDDTKVAIQSLTNGAVSILDWFPEQDISPAPSASNGAYKGGKKGSQGK